MTKNSHDNGNHQQPHFSKSKDAFFTDALPNGAQKVLTDFALNHIVAPQAKKIRQALQPHAEQIHQSVKQGAKQLDKVLSDFLDKREEQEKSASAPEVKRNIDDSLQAKSAQLSHDEEALFFRPIKKAGDFVTLLRNAALAAAQAERQEQLDKQNSELNPAHNTELKPSYDIEHNTELKPALNPDHNAEQNPAHNTELKPAYDIEHNIELKPALNPDHNTVQKPTLPKHNIDLKVKEQTQPTFADKFWTQDNMDIDTLLTRTDDPVAYMRKVQEETESAWQQYQQKYPEATANHNKANSSCQEAITKSKQTAHADPLEQRLFDINELSQRLNARKSNEDMSNTKDMGQLEGATNKAVSVCSSEQAQMHLESDASYKLKSEASHNLKSDVSQNLESVALHNVDLDKLNQAYNQTNFAQQNQSDSTDSYQQKSLSPLYNLFSMMMSPEAGRADLQGGQTEPQILPQEAKASVPPQAKTDFSLDNDAKLKAIAKKKQYYNELIEQLTALCLEEQENISGLQYQIYLIQSSGDEENYDDIFIDLEDQLTTAIQNLQAIKQQIVRTQEMLQELASEEQKLLNQDYKHPAFLDDALNSIFAQADEQYKVEQELRSRLATNTLNKYEPKLQSRDFNATLNQVEQDTSLEKTHQQVYSEEKAKSDLATFELNQPPVFEQTLPNVTKEGAVQEQLKPIPTMFNKTSAEQKQSTLNMSYVSSPTNEQNTQDISEFVWLKDLPDLYTTCNHDAFNINCDKYELSQLRQHKLVERLTKLQQAKVARAHQLNLPSELVLTLPVIVIAGSAGVGKSSLCNKFLQEELCKVSPFEVGTESPHYYYLNVGSKPALCLVDMPGIGVDELQMPICQTQYDKILPQAQLVVWLVNATRRDLLQDSQYFKQFTQHKPSLIVLNQIDALMANNWNQQKNCPNSKLQDIINTIQLRIADIYDVPVSKVLPASALNGFNAKHLLEEIIFAL